MSKQFSWIIYFEVKENNWTRRAWDLNLVFHVRCFLYSSICIPRGFWNQNTICCFHPQYKYQRVILNSDKGLSFSATSTVRSFQRAANAILHGWIKPDLYVLMKLLYTNCVQWNNSAPRTCKNVDNAIRKIFYLCSMAEYLPSLYFIRVHAHLRAAWEGKTQIHGLGILFC